MTQTSVRVCGVRRQPARVVVVRKAMLPQLALRGEQMKGPPPDTIAGRTKSKVQEDDRPNWGRRGRDPSGRFFSEWTITRRTACMLGMKFPRQTRIAGSPVTTRAKRGNGSRCVCTSIRIFRSRSFPRRTRREGNWLHGHGDHETRGWPTPKTRRQRPARRLVSNQGRGRAFPGSQTTEG